MIRRIGKMIAQMQSMKAAATSLGGAALSLCGLYFLALAMMPTAVIRKAAIRRPGTIPAAKSLPMDTSPILPYRISPMLGGIIVTIREEKLMTPAEKPLPYPLWIIPG